MDGCAGWCAPEPRKTEERLTRWRRIAEGACEQCGRSVVPGFEPPRSLEEWLDRRPRDGTRAPGSRVNAAERSRSSRPPERPLTLLVGPEGGLDPREAEQADRSGFVAARLGPRVLRTETAAVAAVAAAQLLWGDLGQGGSPAGAAG